MRVTVKLFAILREQAGVSTMSINLPENSTVDTALKRLLEVHPGLGQSLAKAACALNQAYSPRSTVLKEGDELALIPPVSGG